MESAEIYAQKEKERLMYIYANWNRKARREVLSMLKNNWKRQEKAKSTIKQRTK